MNKIDKIIKKNLENTPDPPSDIWFKIADQLDEKEDKKRLILWYRLPVAAAIVLIAGISFWLFLISDSSIIENSNDGLVSDQDIISNTKNGSTNPSETPTNSQKNTDKKSENIKSHSNYKVDYVVSDLQKLKTNNQLKKTISNQNLKRNLNIAENLSHHNLGQPVNTKLTDENTIAVSSLEIDQNRISKLKNDNKTDKTENALNKAFKNKTSILDSTSIYSQWAKLEEQEKNTTNIEELKDLNPKIKDKEINLKKPLSFSAFAGPAALTSQESLLSGNFNDLNIQNNTNLALGIMIHYPISKTINLRSGLSLTNLSQEIKNTPVISASESFGIASLGQSNDFNIAYTGDIQVIKEPILMQEGSSDKIKHADITQKTQYIEIPLEAEINLLRTKQFDVKAIIGGSSYFLTQNSVSASLESGSQKIGTAKNLNNISFSSNIGLQLQIPLSKKLLFNVEPTVKYLLNPTNNNNNITPFIIGINTGFNFRF